MSKSQVPSISSLLPAIHALTGCDTTSSFFGLGKKIICKFLQKHLEKVQYLLDLSGNNLDIAKGAARKRIALMYNPKKNI